MNKPDRYDVERDIYEVAASLNCSVRLPGILTLQIDLDSEEAFKLFNRRIDFIQRYVPLGPYKSWPSKSGLPKRHVEVAIEGYVPISDPLRLLLQVLLGSDINRELLNTARYLRNGDSQSCFFELLTGGESESESTRTEG